MTHVVAGGLVMFAAGVVTGLVAALCLVLVWAAGRSGGRW